MVVKMIEPIYKMYSIDKSLVSIDLCYWDYLLIKIKLRNFINCLHCSNELL